MSSERDRVAADQHDQSAVARRLSNLNIDDYRRLRDDLNVLQASTENIPMTVSQRMNVDRTIKAIRSLLQ